MARNESYLNIKRYIKSLCKDSVLELAHNIGLTQYQTELLLYVNKNETRISTCLDLNICESKYHKDLKLICEKIHDYRQRKSYSNKEE